MKKLLALVMTILLAAAFVACDFDGNDPALISTPPVSSGNESGATHDGTFKVGISLPTKSLKRWNQDGSNMKEMFEEAGYEVDLQFAGSNDIPLQVSQIETMIFGGCDILVIAAIDGHSLTTVLEGAKANNISVIAYDRLIMDSNAVTCYVTFGNTKIGDIQGQFIVDQLDLEKQDGPFNIELFTGCISDSNIKFFWDGAVEALQPYIDSGKLKVPSKEETIDRCATMGWSTENAQKRMENLIKSEGYGPKGKRLDAVYCANDSIANGVINALLKAGYEGGGGFPVVTGMDGDITSVKNMLAGTQAMSVIKDPRVLTERVFKMIQSIAAGEEPKVNDRLSYDNGFGVVPTYLCEPPICTAENYQELLIGSGFYTEEELAKLLSNP